MIKGEQITIELDQIMTGSPVQICSSTDFPDLVFVRTDGHVYALHADDAWRLGMDMMRLAAARGGKPQ